MFSFDLLTEPWLPAIDSAGEVQEYGLVDLLSRAPEMIALSDPAPSVQLGLYRFLVAFVMDVFELKEEWQLEEVLQSGRFDAARIEAYLVRVGRDRFDLFHAEHPFMQPLVNEDAGVESINKLFQHLPSGGFATLFNHLDSSTQAFEPAVCARGLLTIPPFMTAGGAGYSPSVNGSPPWYVLVRGKNLFETILLNCCIIPLPELDGDEPPAWRTQRAAKPREEMRCSSLLEGLTWRARQIRLLPGPGGDCTYSGRHANVLVREVQFSFGPKYSGGWTDPQVAYSFSENGRSPLRSRDGREIWRDLGPLAFLRQHDYESERGRVRFQRPLVVEQYLLLKNHGVLPGRPSWLDLEVYGLRTDMKMKIFEWQCDRLSLPGQVAEVAGAGLRVQVGMEQAETVDFYLRRAFKIAYPREGKSNEHAFDGLVRAAKEEYWDDLRQRFWTEYLLRLPELDAEDPEAFPALLQQWRHSLRRYGRTVLDRYLEGLDADADGLRRQVEARDFYELGLYKVFFAVKSDDDTDKKRKGRKAS